MRLEGDHVDVAVAAPDTLAADTDFNKRSVKKAFHHRSLAVNMMGKKSHAGAHPNGPDLGFDFLGNNLAAYFSRMFEKNPQGDAALLGLVGGMAKKDKKKCKKCKKGGNNNKSKDGRKADILNSITFNGHGVGGLGGSITKAIPHVAIPRNPSPFAVFAAIRATCLENRQRQATLLQLQSNAAWKEAEEADLNDPNSSDNDQISGIGGKLKSTQLPKIVGIGLQGVFEIIRESRAAYPSVCRRALASLLNILQGLQPEELACEPSNITDPTFEMLLELASSDPATKAYHKSGSSEEQDSRPDCDDGQNIRALAGACLLSFAVAHGDTSKILPAISALLMCSSRGQDNLIMPAILVGLQRSVVSVMLGKTDHPDFMTHGVHAESLSDAFPITFYPKHNQSDISDDIPIVHAMASDGTYLYLQTSNGLFKVGSGYNGTIKGQAYLHNPRFHSEPGWLGHVSGHLYFRSYTTPSEYGGAVGGDQDAFSDDVQFDLEDDIWQASRRGPHKLELIKISTKDLQIDSCIRGSAYSLLGPNDRQNQIYTNNSTIFPNESSKIDPAESPYVLFDDGNNIGAVTINNNDNFVIKFLNPSNNLACVSELPLKLARKCIDIYGSSTVFEEPQSPSAEDPSKSLNTPVKSQKSLQIDFTSEDECFSINAGKDFAFMLSAQGKLQYTGKSTSIGHKQACPSGQWNDINLVSSITSKVTGLGSSSPRGTSCKVIQTAMGHDGAHALLLTDDGVVYFTGTAKRGEDGDQSNRAGRRQPKPVKPKKFHRMEGYNVSYVAANNGSSAMITREGELYMFGKDSVHCNCDYATGHVVDLKDYVITQVAIGKAHIIALTKEGEVFSFGMNNKGQCGREFAAPKEVNATATASSGLCAQPSTETGEASVDIVEDVTSDVNEAEIDQVADPSVADAGIRTDGRGKRLITLCPSGRHHRWKHDKCMVCSFCGECTGYGSVCVSADRPDRNPGTLCGCGSGDSGCAECGVCRNCAGEESPLIPAGVSDSVVAENNASNEILPLPNPASPLALSGGGAINDGTDAVRDFYRLNLLAVGGQGAQNYQALAAGQDVPKLPAHHNVYREKFIRRRIQKMGNCRRSRRYTEKEKEDGNGGNRRLNAEREDLSAAIRANEAAAGREIMIGVGDKERNNQQKYNERQQWRQQMAVPSRQHQVAGIASNNDLGGASNSAASDIEGKDGDRSSAKMTSLSPAKITMPFDGSMKVVQISTGLHHTLMLTKTGDVYAFGSNSHGQLGTGDLIPRGVPTLVPVPKAMLVAAGSYHSVVLTNTGEVFTFGHMAKNQLGREPPIDSKKSDAKSSIVESAAELAKKELWFAHPAPMPKIGSRFGRTATWIGASGDHTFVKIDESLINAQSLLSATVLSNNRHILLIPTNDHHSFVTENKTSHPTEVSNQVKESDDLFENVSSSSYKCLVISRSDGFCRSFVDNDQCGHGVNQLSGWSFNGSQASFQGNAVALDPHYNLIWSYNNGVDGKHLMKCFQPFSVDGVSNNNQEPPQKQLLLSNNQSHWLRGNQISNILTPELALPLTPGCLVSRNQAALNLLSCLDTLAQSSDSTDFNLAQLLSSESEENDIRGTVKGSRPGNMGSNGGGGAISGRSYTKEDYSIVNRFDSHGGGWGYSGHSIEAIRIMSDTDVLLGGFGLFGGRGEYVGKIKLFDIGMDGGDQEGDGDLLAESEEVTYECGARQKFPILFDDPVVLSAGRWYIAWARVSGPSSDCGSSGQTQVTTEDQIQFHFKSSKKSNNGTDVNAGQLPQLLYKIITNEAVSNAHRRSDPPEPVSILTSRFARAVTAECFQSLISLIKWSWTSFKMGINELFSEENIPKVSGKEKNRSGISSNDSQSPVILNLERLIYIYRACLRLCITYTEEVYPSRILQTRISSSGSDSFKLPVPETPKLAECIYDIRTLLQQILTDSLPVLSTQAAATIPSQHLKSCHSMAEMIWLDAHDAFVACFHAFYPTGYLKWACVCNLMATMENQNEMVHLPSTSTDHDTMNYDRLLTAILAALCNPMIKLRNTFPITYSPEADIRCKVFSTSQTSSTMINIPSNEPSATGVVTSVNQITSSVTASMIQAGDFNGATQRFPILTELMNFRINHDGLVRFESWTFRDVLERLLVIASLPVKQALKGETATYSQMLVEVACRVVSNVISELANQTVFSSETDIQSLGGRILQMTPNRFTRTSNSRTWNTGNGSPDAICFSVDRPGIFIVGCCVYGGMGTYDYELELLDDQNGGIEKESGSSASSQRWSSLEMTHGSYSSDDCVSDIAELKFDRSVAIRPHVKYALRLRNHGGRTSNGDGGAPTVKGPDGTTFTFTSCSLSFNGTNPTRGQIPQILYFSSPSQETDVQSSTKSLAEMYARKTALSMTSTIVKTVLGLLVAARDSPLMDSSGGDGESPEPNLIEEPSAYSNYNGSRDKSKSIGLDVLNSAPIINQLMPHVLASISSLIVTDPSSAVQALAFVQDILPSVASLNNVTAQFCMPLSDTEDISEDIDNDSRNVSAPLSSIMATGSGSQLFAWVESDHPYKREASISNYKVQFPPSVNWVTLEFDPRCATAQPEDVLQIYIRNPNSIDQTTASSPVPFQGTCSKNNTNSSNQIQDDPQYIAVLKKFNGESYASMTSGSECNWPVHSAIILPGNELIFSLETASDYVKDEKNNSYGFRCLVVGYASQDLAIKADKNARLPEGLKLLEMELSYLGGTCSASLMKKNLFLSVKGNGGTELTEEDMELAEEAAAESYEMHTALLSKGFALERPPSVHEALDGVIPFSCESKERLFLRNFVHCINETSGGRLARYLQPESYVDVGLCSIVIPDKMRCHDDIVIAIVTNDQYGDTVQANLRVTCRAVPIPMEEMNRPSLQNTASKSINRPDAMTYGGHRPPNLEPKYEVTVKDKMFYHAITVQKSFDNYSFEELRYASPAIQRQSENMLVRANNDGTYSAMWTPANVGWYQLHVTIDNCDLPKVYKVHVQDPPKGIVPSEVDEFSQGWRNSAGMPSIGIDPRDPSESSGCKKSGSHNARLRRFVAKPSAGLRIRVHPTLQSEQIGVVPVDGVLSIVDELSNSDGVWVRVGQDSLLEYVNLPSRQGTNTQVYTEGWCLQFNKHLEKTLLMPVPASDTCTKKNQSRPGKNLPPTPPIRANVPQSHSSPARTEGYPPSFNNTKHQAVLSSFPPETTEELPTLPVTRTNMSRMHTTFGRSASQNPLRCGQPSLGLYTVVKCGASGHNIRSQPSMSASPIGIVNQGDMINVIAVRGARGNDGANLCKGEVWVQLDQDAIEKHCFSNDNSAGTDEPIEAWSLALSANDIQYIKSEVERRSEEIIGLEIEQENRMVRMKQAAQQAALPSQYYDQLSRNIQGGQPAAASFAVQESGIVPTPTIPSHTRHAATSFGPFSQPNNPSERSITELGRQKSLDSISSSRSDTTSLGKVIRKPLPPPRQGTFPSGTASAGNSPSLHKKDFSSSAVSSIVEGAAAAVIGRHRTPSPSTSGNDSRKPSFFSKWFKSDGTVGSGERIGGSHSRSNSPSSQTRKILPPSPATIAANMMNKDIPPELHGVSVKELVKVIGESRANGNGVTPPGTPGTNRRSANAASRQSSPSAASSPASSRGSSPNVALASKSRSISTMQGNSAVNSISPLSQTPRSTSYTEGGNAGLKRAEAKDTNQARPQPASDSIQIDRSLEGASASGTSIRYHQQKSLIEPPKSSEGNPINSTDSIVVDHKSINNESGISVDKGIETAVSLNSQLKGADNYENDTSYTLPRRNLPQTSKMTNSLSRVENTKNNIKVVNKSNSVSIKNSGVASGNTSSQIHRSQKGAVKEAMSPSVAESIRSVFAAFVWHEGIVHDAMTIASYLKFHPDISKYGDISRAMKSFNQQHTISSIANLEKDSPPTGRQRHSVDSISSDYLSTRAQEMFSRGEIKNMNAAKFSGGESILKRRDNNYIMNANVHNRNIINQKMISEGTSKLCTSEGLAILNDAMESDHISDNTMSISQFQPQIGFGLPPTLRLFILLWEEIRSYCIHAILQQVIVAGCGGPIGPIQGSNSNSKSRHGHSDPVKSHHRGSDKERKSKRSSHKRSKGTGSHNERNTKIEESRDYLEAWSAFGGAGYPPGGLIPQDAMQLAAFAEARGRKNVLPEKEEFCQKCELCNQYFQHPVTYHMKAEHPGCGQHAGGKGYNSGGHYCGGWAGNCGDGGVGGTSWYLICDKCRNAYLKNAANLSPPIVASSESPLIASVSGATSGQAASTSISSSSHSKMHKKYFQTILSANDASLNKENLQKPLMAPSGANFIPSHGEKRSIHGTGVLPLGSENNPFLGSRNSIDINAGSLRQNDVLSASAYSTTATNTAERQLYASDYGPSAQNSHIIMNNNAMFLLDLSSASSLSSQIPKFENVTGNQRKYSNSSCGSQVHMKFSELGTCHEEYAFSSMDPNPFGKVTPFQCFQALGVKNSHLQHINDELVLDETSAKMSGLDEICHPPRTKLPSPLSDALSKQSKAGDFTNDMENVSNVLSNSSLMYPGEAICPENISPPEQFQTSNEKESIEASFTKASNENEKTNIKSQTEIQSTSPKRPFGRSVSVTNHIRPEASNNSVLEAKNRKRNSSYETYNLEQGDNESEKEANSFLSQPSTALQKLFISHANPQEPVIITDILQRPVMGFVLQWNDLDSLQIAMTTGLRKAAARSYAMQALNWLLRNVSQPDCLHDLLWCFAASLESKIGDSLDSQISPLGGHSESAAGAEKSSKEKKNRRAQHSLALVGGGREPNNNINQPNKNGDQPGLFEHPSSDINIAGDAIEPLPSTFHNLLQTISDLMLLLPTGSSLQQIAITCWGIKFWPSDHHFLHRSHVFSTISKILSKSEEMGSNVDLYNAGPSSRNQANKIISGGSHLAVNDLSEDISYADAASVCVIKASDISSSLELKVSSRQAMIGSLTDNSSETFWESGDEDRNKSKWINIAVPPQHNQQGTSAIITTVSVHVDNCRDLGNKVANVAFKAGKSNDELVTIKQIDVESRFAGWISCFLPEVNHSNQKIVKVELKGPDNTLRLRQVKVLGHFSSPEHDRKLLSPTAGKLFQKQNNSPMFSGVRNKPESNNQKGTELCMIQQRNCEVETLRVFRLITSQVFGRLLEENADAVDGRLPKVNIYNNELIANSEPGNQFKANDQQSESNLKEHVVGILFSRQKLTHLQKQVCAHIVRAIRKESTRIREEWEFLLCSASVPPNSAPSKTLPLPDVGVNIAGTSTAQSLNVLDHEGPITSPDTYCFEMLSLVLALSGSSVGRSYIASQLGLVKDLLALLHTGTARIQRQVIALLRRVLPEISPASFGSILGITNLPPKDFSSLLMSSSQSNLQEHLSPNPQDEASNSTTFNMQKPGIIDVFLSCIAKALTLQVKIKGSMNTKESNIGGTPKNTGLGRQNIASCSLATAIHPKDPTGPRWWIRGALPKKIAEEIVCFLKDMTSGKFSEEWAAITKSAIAENILNLTRLDEKHRDSGECLRYPVVWLALASLCVLDKDHVEALSSGEWSAAAGAAEGGISPPRPTCENHDDGETLAVVVCDVCGNLCLDCDRFLHLHRKTKSHSRQVFKEEEEAIKVDLHEGCGRAKLFWIMALADSLTLKAMVEFREGSNRGGKITGIGTSGGLGGSISTTCFSTCRFCGRQSSAEMPVLDSVCSDSDCVAFSHTACTKILPCGHFCGGIADEVECLPCLHGCSSTMVAAGSSKPVAELRQDADDMCMICFTDALSPIPSIQLACGHVFHHHCCVAVLDKRWVGPRITFGFRNCPICKTKIEHPSLKWLLDPIDALYEDVKKKAQMRLEYEGLSKCDAVTTKGARFYNDPESFAIDRYAYYVCFKCGKAYYGGEAQCDADAGLGDTYNPEELVCGGCSDVSRAQMCPKHGTDYLEYKCRYCCSVAVFFCFGTTHFCNACHDDFQRVANVPKQDLPQCPVGPKSQQLDVDECPLHVNHPPTGEEFALGCGICRNAHTF